GLGKTYRPIYMGPPIRVPERGNRIGFRSAGRIVLMLEVLRIPEPIEHPVNEMRAADNQHAATGRIPVEVVAGYRRPSSFRPALIGEAANRSEVSGAQKSMHESDAG